MISRKTEQFIASHGEWTAMGIKLADGSYTRAPEEDNRLRRLVQTAADVVKKPLSQCRVLDLACLEGHYAIEFAAHGACGLGIEGREVSVAKCNYVRDDLGLDKLEFVQGDVRDFSVEKHGSFDIIVCSGILYHLVAEDAAQLIRQMRRACTGALLIDTFISLSGRDAVVAGGRERRGHYYHEHDPGADTSAALWASLDNPTSFWFTEPSLVNLLTEAGFTSVCTVLAPTMATLADRKTYLAIPGEPVPIFTSDATASAQASPVPEGVNRNMDASQTPPGALHRTAKRLLPPVVKNSIKPLLRVVHILPPDPTPAFLKAEPR